MMPIWCEHGHVFKYGSKIGGIPENCASITQESVCELRLVQCQLAFVTDRNTAYFVGARWHMVTVIP